MPSRARRQRRASHRPHQTSSQRSVYLIVLGTFLLFASLLFLSAISHPRSQKAHAEKKRPVTALPRKISVAFSKKKAPEAASLPRVDLGRVDKALRSSLQEEANVPVPTPAPVSLPVPVPKKAAEKSAAATPVPQKPKIAVVLDDWGYSEENLGFLSSIHLPLTVAIIPFRDFSRITAEFAHEHGEEVIIHMPMEPNEKERYGLEPKTLLTGMGSTEIVSLLREAIDSIPYAKGMNNHMGSKATMDKRFMTIVLKELKRQHFFFLDSLVIPQTVCRDVAKQVGIPFVRRAVFLDNESGLEYIRSQLMELARDAEKSGSAVGIGHARRATLQVLQEVIPQLAEQGFEFVHLSELER